MDDSLLKSLGDEAIGVISAACTRRDLDTTSNKRFVAACGRTTATMPGWLYNRHVRQRPDPRGGAAEDRRQDRRPGSLHQGGAQAVSLTDTPRGAIKFDQYGNVVGDVFIRNASSKDGKIVNTVIKTYPNVSQFWTYDEKKFLAQAGLFARLSADEVAEAELDRPRTPRRRPRSIRRDARRPGLA